MFSNPLSRVIIVLLLLSAGVCAAGCGDVCEPGETQACDCAGDSTGTQTCNSVGDGWGACEGCDTTTPPPPVTTCHPSGYTILYCGCNGFVALGTTFPTGLCCSGQALHAQCGDFCPGGGYPWGNVCL